MGFLLLALIGATAASFFVYDEFIDNNDDDNGVQDDVPPEFGEGPQNPDDPENETPDPDTATGPVTIFGTEGDDTLENRDDSDFALPGSDTIEGLGGKDELQGDSNSVVRGGDGRDFLTLSENAQGFGGDGNDRLLVSDNAVGFGEDGNDNISLFDSGTGYGGEGDDKISGDTGGTQAFGGPGNDAVGAPSGSFADGGPNDDYVNGSLNSTILGGSGDDTLDVRNSDGENFADAGSGDDVIRLSDRDSGGMTTLIGGEGDDQFFVQYAELRSEPDTPDIGEDGEGTRIADFVPNEDMLLIGGRIPSEIDFLDTGENGTEIALSYDDGSTYSIFLDNVANDELSVDDLGFVEVDDPGLVQIEGEFDLTLGTEDGDAFNLSTPTAIGAADGDDTVSVTDTQALIDLGRGQDLAEIDGGASLIRGGEGDDTVMGSANFLSVLLQEGDDVATVTVSGPGIGGSDFGGFIEAGSGDDIVTLENPENPEDGSRLSVRIDGGEGADTLRFGHNVSVDADGEDTVTFVLSDDDGQMSEIDFNGATGPTVLNVELTDTWTLGEDAEVSVIDTPRLGDDAILKIADREVARISGLSSSDLFTVNVTRF